MFRSSKHRPKEEEDSLVPHGMIWHGTPQTPPSPSDESLDSTAKYQQVDESPVDESLEPTVQYAQVMEMMRRGRKTPVQQTGQDNGAQRESASAITRPAAVPWWRIPHPDPEEAPAPPLPPPAAAVTPHAKWPLPPKIEVLTAPPSTASPPATPEVGNEVRETEEVKEVKQEVKNDLKNDFKEKENDFKEDRPARVPAWLASAAVIDNFTRSSLAHSRQLAEQGKRLFSRAAPKAISDESAPRWRPPRIRIVLTGLPLRIRNLLARQLSESKMRKGDPEATHDARLRSAMIIAAACAVLGLVGVWLAPRFTARFLPSRTLRTGSAVGTKTVGPSTAPSASRVAQSSHSGRPQSPQNRKSHNMAARAKSQGEKPTPRRQDPHRKHHPTQDGDYVAPDTYTYYGHNASH